MKCELDDPGDEHFGTAVARVASGSGCDLAAGAGWVEFAAPVRRRAGEQHRLRQRRHNSAPVPPSHCDPPSTAERAEPELLGCLHTVTCASAFGGAACTSSPSLRGKYVWSCCPPSRESRLVSIRMTSRCTSLRR